ncbi:hypothetical protein [[Eubacterium] cellulosolvens]
MGRGRGFEVVDKSPASNELPAVQSIKRRLLDLVVMMCEDGMITGDEVADKLGLTEEEKYVPMKKHNKLLAKLEESENELDSLENELDRTRSEIKSFYRSFNDMVDDIAEALDEDPDNWDIDEDDDEGEDENDDGWSLAALEFGVDRLIDDYLALKGSEEEDQSV